MKIFILFFSFLPFKNVFGQNDSINYCQPSTTFKTILCPSLDCPCPIGLCCYTRLASNSKNLIVISFKLTAYNLCDTEIVKTEADNIGDNFSVRSVNILQKVCKGSIIVFTCVKAKNKAGKVFMLQPLTLKL